MKRPSQWPITAVADNFGITLAPLCEDQLVLWLDTLLAWNARLDLTAARTVNELVDLMLADAFAVAKTTPEGASLVDVGAGAGAPGLALAIVRPDLKVTLVEPLTKRVSFLRTVLGKLGRTDVLLVRAHAEDVTMHFDVAISRATLPPSVWLSLGLSLADRVWVLLAKDDAPFHPRAEIVQELAYQWPLTGAPRRMVGYRTTE